MTAFYEQFLRQEGLRLPQYSLLMHLSDKPQPLQQLAERMEMDRTTLTRRITSYNVCYTKLLRV